MGFYSRLKLFEQPSAKMREAALQALASVGMDDFANRDYLTLSGGEQQLVILARTLIEDTSLLLFDAPDSSLDLGNKYRMMGLIADIVQAAQGGRSASPAFFPYKKEPVSTHSHTGPDCLQQSHSLRECTSLAHSCFFHRRTPPEFPVTKNTLSTGQLQSVPRVSLMHIPYFILYDLTSVRRHLEFRSEHFTRTAAHEHAL